MMRSASAAMCFGFLPYAIVLEGRDDGERHELDKQRSVAGARRHEREHWRHDGERAEEPVHEVARAGHLRGQHAFAHLELHGE
jgi:hypothetical protein